MGICYLYKRGSGSGGSGGSIVEIIKTASGSIITLSDSAPKALRGLKVYGKTTQNGTPTPDAPVPLESVGDSGSVAVTVCSKNLFDNTGINVTSGVGISFDADGDYVKLSGTKVSGANIVTVKRPNIILPAGTYTVFVKIVGGTVTPPSSGSTDYGVIFGINQSTYEMRTAPLARNVGDISKRTFTLESDTLITSFDITPGYGGEGAVYNDLKAACMLVRGDTANEFIPGKPIQSLTIQKSTEVSVLLPGIPVTSGGNYTDENGQQWICDEVDAGRGKYVQRVGCVDLGTLSWAYDSTGYFQTIPSSPMTDIAHIDVYSVPNGLCSIFPILSINNAAKVDYDNISWYYVASQSRTAIRVYLNGCTNVSEFLTAMSGAMIYYELVEPIETPLSAEELAQYAVMHTNYPNTTIFNDGGADMEVKYVTIGG